MENKDTTKKTLLCHVRLRPNDMPVTYAVKDLDINEGEWVVVPTEHGIEVGQVVDKPISVELPEKSIPPFVERLATTSEIEDYYKNIEFEKKAWQICQKHIDKLGLIMKLIKVECFFDKSKIIFFYSADGRVDFRELVKELVRELRMRVEMRQIGIRHEAKLIGGLGCCGREICCAKFLTSFDSISIKMAKAQNLPLNPSKISGLCGRLLCCLTYEYETYKEMSQNLPSLGKACQTPTGQGKVIRQNIFKQAVTVAMPDGSFVEYTVDELGDKNTEEEEAKKTEKEEFTLKELAKDTQLKEQEKKEEAYKKQIEEKERKSKDQVKQKQSRRSKAKKIQKALKKKGAKQQKQSKKKKGKGQKDGK